MKINARTRLLALIGSPVKQSFSPTMHNAAFEKLNINAKYLAFNLNRADVKSTLEGFKAMNIIGCNVTKPYKEIVVEHLDVVDEVAKKIGAVNTIVHKENKLYGYNTDLYGFIEAFKIRKIDLKAKSVAILGSGGASKAIAIGLLEENVKLVHVFSRNVKKVNFLTDIHIEIKNNIEVYDLPYDIIINATPNGMNHELSHVDVSKIGHKDSVFYDLIYNPKETAFLRDARLTNRQTINGLDMLIYQGLKALELWFDFDTKLWKREDVLSVLQEAGVIEI